MFYHIEHVVTVQHFDELNMMPPLERECTVFRYSVTEVPLFFEDGDLLAGRFGFQECPAELKQPVPHFSSVRPLSEEQERIKKAFLQNYGIKSCFNYAHTCISYQTVLERGLTYYIDCVQAEQAKTAQGFDSHVF